MSATAKLDNFTGSLEELQKLRGEVQEFKATASRNSENLMRAQMEIGSLQKSLEQIPALQAEIDLLEKHNEELASKLKEANKSIREHEATAAKNEAKLRAFDAFSAAFSAVTDPAE